MPDKINIASMGGLKRHYKDEHGFNLPTENIIIHNQKVHFIADATDYQMRFCSFCGKELVINNKKIRLAKILDNLENTVLLDAEHSTTNLIIIIHELSTNIKKTNSITNPQIQQLVRMGVSTMVERNVE